MQRIGHKFYSIKINRKTSPGSLPISPFVEESEWGTHPAILLSLKYSQKCSKQPFPLPPLPSHSLSLKNPMQLEELSLGWAKASPLLPQEDFLIVPCCGCSTLHQPTLHGWAAAHTSVFYAQTSPSCWLMNLTPRSGNMATRYGFGDKRGSLFLLLLLTAGETETAVGFTVCIPPTTGWVTKAPLPLPLKPKGFRCHPQALGNPSWL